MTVRECLQFGLTAQRQLASAIEAIKNGGEMPQAVDARIKQNLGQIRLLGAQIIAEIGDHTRVDLDHNPRNPLGKDWEKAPDFAPLKPNAFGGLKDRYNRPRQDQA